MKSKANGTIQSAQRLNNAQGEGPNWLLIAGGALLSTLSIRLGCKLKQVFDTKQRDYAKKENRKPTSKSTSKGHSGACQLHTNLYLFNQDDDTCYHCPTVISGGGVEIKQPRSPTSKGLSFPQVEVPAAEPNKDREVVIWGSSPGRLELPRKPFHHSNSSDSPCMSESGSDIYSKREVIQKLRQQLKRRDEMIMEMQTQITDMQNSLSIQITHSAHLQAQVDAAIRELLESEREIQHLRKVIADHCVAEVVSPEKPDSADDLELHCVGVEKAKVDGEKVEMLKMEVGELKEVIGGKDFLIQSYKEQKVELCLKIKELQLKLASQVPNIL